ncbi:MAG: peptidase [Aulosira sp. ZfuVER01]|nr:peptidase [Aulosira sp. ZfuVER01]MDZ8000168.1 peptidase [Aulosira sp. DedVER01a]MDZ8055676.1 peptidase [Aulosira sp. ZfuCHP01]
MKRAFRKYHRTIAIAIFLPLTVSIVTGISMTLTDQWFHQPELTGFILKIHTGEIFGLAGIYPILHGLGLIGLIVTGLSLTGLFSQLYKPRKVGD